MSTESCYVGMKTFPEGKRKVLKAKKGLLEADLVCNLAKAFPLQIWNRMVEAHTLSMVTRHAGFEFFLRCAWIRRMRGRNRILLVSPSSSASDNENKNENEKA